MFLGIRKKYRWMLVASVVLIGGVCFVHLSSAFALRTCHVTGPLADNTAVAIIDSLQQGHNVFRLDSKTFVGKLLQSKYIENVTLRIQLPSGVRAEINRFSPIALVLSDKLYGLDTKCRLIPFDTTWERKNLPVLTGLSCSKLFVIPNDYRLASVMAGLQRIRNEFPDFYMQIAEINFAEKAHVTIYLTTGNETYVALSQNFYNQLLKLRAIREMAISTDGGWYNLQFDDMVVKQ